MEEKNAMIHPDQFDRLLDALMSLNDIDERTAARAVSLAGDCREVDNDGLVIVEIDGKKRALKWPK